MTYFLLIQGSGNGCDYTIGCNQTWKIIDSPKPLTEERLQDIMVETCEYYGDENIDSISVVEASSFKLHHASDIMAESRRIEREEKDAELEARERAELARLQDKFS